ncbi:MAG: hypothetical protein GWN14_05215 [candidate division Zixibacteria bacterium]|nr:hypothetical protein [candidate division Zixibacteria bacterium]
MSDIYVLWLEANFVPDEFISKSFCKAAHERLRKEFPNTNKIKQVLFENRPASLPPWAEDKMYCPNGMNEFSMKLCPGDIVIGGIAVQEAAMLCRRGVLLYSHNKDGDLFRYRAACDEKPILNNPPWNTTGGYKKQ